MTSTIDDMVRWAIPLRAADVPGEALDLAKKAFLDTIAVSLSGSRLEATRIAAALALEAGGQGPCSLIGQGRKATVLAAGLCNGTAAHAELYDDNSEPMLAHPSASLVSTLLPLAQQRKLGGLDVLLAYVTGFEINVALGRRVNPAMYEAGWHVTRTLGVLGATAAAGKLIGLGPGPFAAAIGIAASMASGLRQNFGTMTMALHAGLTARDAIQAALLAEKGFLSDADALDGRYGFFNQFVGRTPAAPIAFGRPFELVASGIIFKPYPSGAPTHAAVFAAIALHRELGGDAARIERIVCRVHPWNFMTLREGVPQDTLRARVSMRYCVAAALRFGDLGSRQFTDAALADPDVQRLMPLVEIRQDDGLPDNGLLPAQLDLQLEDGSTLSHRCEIPPGAPARPMSPADADRKYRGCAAVVLDDRSVERSRAMILGLDTLAEVDRLCTLLEG